MRLAELEAVISVPVVFTARGDRKKPSSAGRLKRVPAMKALNRRAAMSPGSLNC